MNIFVHPFFRAHSTIGDQVVVVGGGSKGDVYELKSWQWVKVGCMQYGWNEPTVAVLPRNRLLAVCTAERYLHRNEVELAVLLNKK